MNERKAAMKIIDDPPQLIFIFDTIADRDSMLNHIQNIFTKTEPLEHH